MPQEPSSNASNKSKKRSSGRRRNYVDSFRWGFVSEGESDGGAVSVSDTRKTDARKADTRDTDTGKPNTKKSDPKKAEAGKKNASPPSKQSRPNKKSAKVAEAKPEAKPATPSRGTPKSGGNNVAKNSSVNKNDTVKQPTKTPAAHSPKQSAPGKRPPKNKGRTKTVIPPYVASSHYEDDEDLRLPSYGRTPIPTDDELPVPQKIVRQGKPSKTSLFPKAAVATFTESASDLSAGARPRREQMVWDPDKQEYVPLTTKKEPEPKKPPMGTADNRQPTEKQQTADGRRQQRAGDGVADPQLAKPTKQQERAEKPKAEQPPKPAKPQRPPREKKQVEGETDKAVSRPPAERRQTADGRRQQREPATVSPTASRQPTKTQRGDIPKFVETSHPDPTDVEAEVSGFAELGVSETMLEALKIVRYLEPTPIQAGVFQKVVAGVDVMGQARTGTGKTAAFSMPLIEGVETCPPGNSPVALILVPTRELAVQVRDEAMRLAYGRDIRITACYGGKPLAKQIERLRGGIDIVVGTPGRILDLMRRRALSLDSLRWVVLDEADRMLDIGFRPDIEKILKQTPPERQTLLFSATLPPPVVRLAEKYMKSPEVLDFSEKSVAVETIDQFYVTVDPERKFDALVYLLEEQQPKQAIIFTRTKRGADRLARLLAKQLDQLAAIHGDLQQSDRDRVMARFRSGSLRYLVATDVVGRGIDVSGISHIINYDIPKFCDDYVHRVGRTGRMGREGVAFTFVTVQEGSELTRIEMRIDKLLKRAELKGFESFTKPHDPNASLDDDLSPEPPKPVFGKPVRKVRRAL